MKFGMSAAEAAEEPSRGGGSSDYIRRLKDGENTQRICQEPPEWTYFWEHFNPAGFSFPCPRKKDDPIDMCPGCSSEIEKMKKVAYRAAFNCIRSYNGTDYVNVLKVPQTVADKLENRYKRFGTVTDRDYIISRYKTAGDRYDFDVEGTTPTPIDLRKEEWHDIESLLQKEWDDAWGNPAVAEANARAAQAAAADPSNALVEARVTRPTIAPEKPKVQPEEPPFEEERTYQAAELRSMDPEALITLIKNEMHLEPPVSLTTSSMLVDWLIELQS